MEKILIIKKGAIGDLLMATPFIRQLKRSMSCEIDLLVGKSSAIAIKNNPNISNLIIENDALFSIKQAHKFIAKLYKLRTNQYDYVFVLDKHWYFNLCANILGAITVGFRREKISKYLLDFAVEYNDINKYQGIYYLELLTSISQKFVNFNDLTLDLDVSLSDKSTVDYWLTKNNVDNFVIVVNSGGNNAFETSGIRMVPDDKILQLLEKLAHNYKHVILAGGNVDTTKYNYYITELNKYNNIISVAGKFTLSESCYLFHQAQKLYLTDCGALHLAVASGNINFIAFFCVTNPRHFLPEYLLQNAYWQDEDIYTPNYSLYGNKGIKHKEYFTKLNIEHLCSV